MSEKKSKTQPKLDMDQQYEKWVEEAVEEVGGGEGGQAAGHEIITHGGDRVWQGRMVESDPLFWESFAFVSGKRWHSYHTR